MARGSWRSDPATPSLLLFGGLVLTGFVAIGFGWRAAARTLFVPFQTPALVSGGMGGLGLVLLGCGFFSVQAGRRRAAQERASTELLLQRAASLVEAARQQAGRP